MGVNYSCAKGESLRPRSFARTVAPAIATFVGVSLFLTGCAEEIIPEPLPPIPAPEEPEEPEVSEVEPLSSFINAVWAEDARHKIAEQLVADCMAFNGFDYVPEPMPDHTPLPLDGPAPGTLEFAETYGYGIVTYPESVIPEDDLEDIEPGPNDEYFNSLDPEEQIEYTEALEGTAENKWEGCRFEARKYSASQDPDRVYDDPRFDTLMTALEELPDSYENDVRFVELRSEWLICMLTAGHSNVGERGETEAILTEEYAEVLADPNGDVEAFQAREIEIATADYLCAEEVSWDEVEQDIVDDIETEFVITYLADLEALVTRYGVR